MLYCREIQDKFETDVFVAGGGPAGVAAAVTCAREGRRVFLCDARGAFGGLGTVGMVPAFMPFADGIHFLAGGIGEEIRNAVSERRDNERSVYNIRAEELKKLYDRMVTEAGVEFRFFTNVIDVETDGKGRVERVICYAKSGIFSVKAKFFVDCTGDGDLCALAGADFEMGDETGTCMPATLCSLWANIDFSKVAGEDNRCLEAAIKDGVFTAEDRHLPGIWRVDEKCGVGGGNIGHCFALDATDEESLTKAMLHGRSLLKEYERYYKNYLNGFENMTLAMTSDMMGVRESRRIMGDYVLCHKDYHDRAVFEDEIGRYNYPVDIHIMRPDKEAFNTYHGEFTKKTLGKGESYGIPYRCLIPRKLKNVLVAGRCVSADRAMQASIRVMPGCYITGQACGMAAALAKEEVRDVDIRVLQKKLVDMGAYLPNFKEETK